jgi:hypothetical protein
MISRQGGRFVPVPFSELIDEETGRMRVRLVNILSTRYAIARRYMIRLRRDDFDDPHELAKLAATDGLSVEDFRRQFEHLVRGEAPPLVFDATATHQSHSLVRDHHGSPGGLPLPPARDARASMSVYGQPSSFHPWQYHTSKDPPVKDD